MRMPTHMKKISVKENLMHPKVLVPRNWCHASLPRDGSKKHKHQRLQNNDQINNQPNNSKKFWIKLADSYTFPHPS